MKMNKRYKSTADCTITFNDRRINRKWVSYYGQMFIEDFIHNLCFTALRKKDIAFVDREQFRIEEFDSKLKKMITLSDYTYLEYGLGKVITNSLYTLLTKGKSYLQVVYYLDDNDNVIGFDFKELYYEKILKGIKNIKFYYPNSSGRKVLKISKDDLICLKCSKCGFKKRELRKIEKGLRDMKLFPISAEKMYELNVDFMHYNKEEKLNLLRITKNIPWNGRDSRNEYITYQYYLFRLAKFRKQQIILLKYIVDEINAKLIEIGNKNKFKGSIVYDALSEEDIDEIINMMNNGELQFDDALKCLLYNHKVNKL